MIAALRRHAALPAILILALLLRLYGIHNPILDHPGWRQGDEAAIARNFALLRDNILYPQVDYDGPPPNYAELELQIVPFAAAQLYRVFGVHETLARLIVVAFSLAEVWLLYLFRRDAFDTVGGLDASARFGPEDVDFCLRVRDAGWRVVQVDGPICDHPPRRAFRGVWTRRGVAHVAAFARHSWRHRRRAAPQPVTSGSARPSPR